MKLKILSLITISFLIPTVITCSQRKKIKQNNQSSQTIYKKVTTTEVNPLRKSDELITANNSIETKENNRENTPTKKKKKIVNPHLNKTYGTKLIADLSKSLQREVTKILDFEQEMFSPYQTTRENELNDLEEKNWPSQYKAASTNIPLASSLTRYKYGERYDQEHNIILQLLNNYQKNDDPEIIEWELQKHTGTQRKINYFIAESINQSTITFHDFDTEEINTNDPSEENNTEEVISIFIKPLEKALTVIKQSLQQDPENDKYPIVLWTQPEQQEHGNLGQLLQEKRLVLYEVIVEHIARYMDHVRKSLKSNTIETIVEYEFPKNIKRFAKVLYEVALKINHIHHNTELNYDTLCQYNEKMSQKLSKWVLISQAHSTLKENNKILKQILELNNRRITFNKKIEDLKADQIDMLSMSIMPHEQVTTPEENNTEANPENKETVEDTKEKEEETPPGGLRSYIPFY